MSLPPPDQRLLPLQVAYLTTKGYPQSDIQTRLHLSQSDVSRKLGEARANGWIEEVLKPPEDIDKTEVEQCDAAADKRLQDAIARLAKTSGRKTPPTLHVVYSGKIENVRRKKFAANAAKHLVALLADTENCAVAWGQTIQSVIECCSVSASSSRNIRFFPVAGEPLNHTFDGMSPSTAAEQLSKVFGSKVRSLSLRGIATRIPKACTTYSKQIRLFYKSCDDYLTVFGGKAPLVESADAIVTSVGDAQSSVYDAWFQETVKAEEITTHHLQKLSVGNIGGIWLHHNESNQNDIRRVDQMNERWLGAQLTHFAKCARDAEQSRGKPKPGVIVLACGNGKRRILERVVGLSNHIIMDHTLAESLW